MTHEEYTTGIAKQQSLINRLLTCREKRSKIIDDITHERYYELIGKFFKADERLKSAMQGSYYYIVGIQACSNYMRSSDVVVKLICHTYETTKQGCGDDSRIVGVDFITHTFIFEPTDDIIEFIEPMFVSKEEATQYFNNLVSQMNENFLSLIK